MGFVFLSLAFSVLLWATRLGCTGWRAVLVFCFDFGCMSEADLCISSLCLIGEQPRRLLFQTSFIYSPFADISECMDSITGI